ncbi:MAG TPA: GNAT family N-acetyltransferase [Ignavibacteriaceae bacterium]|nr:GNAT family N-acetyltransferase [Ignavibacteriaceae bacterium]
MGPLDPKIVEKSLPKSVFAVTAKHKDVIAFAGVVCDGGLCFHSQEIIVHPYYQKRGIARTFMKYVFNFLNYNAAQRSYISVFVGQVLEGRPGLWM